MATFSQLPGTLNLELVRGDNFSALLDFSISMTGYTVTSAIQSLITGADVQAFTVTLPSPENGQVNIALTDTQTAALPRGTYGWQLRWVEGANTRTALTGFVEVR